MVGVVVVVAVAVAVAVAVVEVVVVQVSWSSHCEFRSSPSGLLPSLCMLTQPHFRKHSSGLGVLGTKPRFLTFEHQGSSAKPPTGAGTKMPWQVMPQRATWSFFPSWPDPLHSQGVGRNQEANPTFLPLILKLVLNPCMSLLGRKALMVSG